MVASLYEASLKTGKILKRFPPELKLLCLQGTADDTVDFRAPLKLYESPVKLDMFYLCGWDHYLPKDPRVDKLLGVVRAWVEKAVLGETEVSQTARRRQHQLATHFVFYKKQNLLSFCRLLTTRTFARCLYSRPASSQRRRKTLRTLRSEEGKRATHRRGVSLANASARRIGAAQRRPFISTFNLKIEGQASSKKAKSTRLCSLCQ